MLHTLYQLQPRWWYYKIGAIFPTNLKWLKEYCIAHQRLEKLHSVVGLLARPEQALDFIDKMVKGSNRKTIEFFVRLILAAAFIALITIKVHDLLLEETGISLHTENIDVEIPRVSICFSDDVELEEILPSHYIKSTKIESHSLRNGITTKTIANEEWKQFFYTTYETQRLRPCFYLDSPISTIQHPDFAKVVLTFFFGSI